MPVLRPGVQRHRSHGPPQPSRRKPTGGLAMRETGEPQRPSTEPRRRSTGPARPRRRPPHGGTATDDAAPAGGAMGRAGRVVIRGPITDAPIPPAGWVGPPVAAWRGPRSRQDPRPQAPGETEPRTTVEWSRAAVVADQHPAVAVPADAQRLARLNEVLEL